MAVELHIPYSGKFWQGEYWRIGFIQLNWIENIESENLDGSLAKRQIRQNFPPIKISHYTVLEYI